VSSGNSNAIFPNGVTIWLTGLSGSGKSTLAAALLKRFEKSPSRIEVLDGEELRKHSSAGLGFTKEDRDEHIRRIAETARALTETGAVVIVAAISPYRAARQEARQKIVNFIEVYCRCPLAVAEARDTKGLYGRARRGELLHFTGIDDPYEEPLHPEVIVDTDKETVSASVEKILAAIERLKCSRGL
jgi:adenylyl-sulfate kinase